MSSAKAQPKATVSFPVAFEKRSSRSLYEISDPFYGMVIRISELGMAASNSRNSPFSRDIPRAKTGPPEIL